jgi:hypothetical protein
MSDISFLSGDERSKETQIRQTPPPAPAKPDELAFVVPATESDDIEVIEIDEGELEDVLANEPFLARAVYRLNLWVEEAKIKLFQRPEPVPPPKTPPQFFQGKPGGKAIPAPESAKAALAPLASPAIQAEAAALRASGGSVRITPLPNAPHRVRVIKRVRRPVRVSFVEGDGAGSVDVGKRAFTLGLLGAMCLALVVGGRFALAAQLRAGNAALADARSQVHQVQEQIRESQKRWTSFQDLEPRLKALVKLLDAHRRPTSFLQKLEDMTLPTVSYGSFTMTADRRVQLAISADSLPTAARQILQFQRSPYISAIEASGYTFVYDRPEATEPRQVLFQATLTVTDAALGPSEVAAAP